MASKLLGVILVCFLVWGEGSGNYDVKLSKIFWDGGLLYFPVKRAKLQQRLDEINCEFRSKLPEVKLYLPSQPVLQHLISRDEHVVMVAFGNMTSVSFNEAFRNGEVQAESTVIEGFVIMIPYLATEKGGTPRMTYQMKQYSTTDGQIKANVVLPSPIVADRFIRESDGNYDKILFQKDDLQLQVIGRSVNQRRPGRLRVDKDVRKFEEELQISLQGADFSICDRFPDLQVDLCNVYRDPTYNPILANGGVNVCMYWVPEKSVQIDYRTIHVEAISNKMKELLLLDDESDISEGELQMGTFDIRLVFPCIEG